MTYSFCFRPVIAVVDVEAEQSYVHKLAMVHKEVLKANGPADPSIVIRTSCDHNNEQKIEVDLEVLMEKLDAFGPVVLLR